MAYIPTLAELQTQIENDIRTELGITKTWYGKVALKVIALVQAAKLKLYYIFLSAIQKNIFADTADSELNGGTLERFGRVKLGRDPYPATAGEYVCEITGTVGATIKAGTTFKNALNEKLYVLEFDYTLATATDSITLRALEAGLDSVLNISDTVTSTSPIELVNSTATVTSVSVVAEDAETIEEYRNSVLQAFRLEPQGGASSDYRLWSLDVTGVRTSYPYTKYAEPWTVQVYVEANETATEPGEPIGVPTAYMLAEVAAVIEQDPDTTKALSDRGRRPIGTYEVEVLSVVPIPIKVEIIDLSDKSLAVTDAIDIALKAAFANIRPYIAGADGEIKNDILSVSTVIATIFNAIDSGITFSAVNLYFSLSLTPFTTKTFGSVPATFGNYPYLYSLQTP
jgi:uncharacterized phage protein gp47/JayE